MISQSEVQQKFNHIQQSIGQAVEACQNEQGTTQRLKNSIEKLDQRCSMAADDIKSNDPSRMTTAVDDLEMLGDDAKRACQEAGQVPARLKEAVIQVHDELSDLKHKIH